MTDRDSTLARAAAAIREGAIVVYPTETVYGLGADALDPTAVERVFDAKRRDRSQPISLAVPSVPAALQHVRATDRERRFMATFLPGPVTVLCRRRDSVPDVLTGGRERVGVRVPDHPAALALCERAGTPITATSANVSGRPSARTPDELDPEIRTAAAVVLDGAERVGIDGAGATTASDPNGASDATDATDGADSNAASDPNDATDRAASTVVDVSTGTIHRRGARAAAIEAWLARERQ